MSAASDFHAWWSGDRDPETEAVELLPVRLTRACVDVLGADGAGLAVLEEFRVPIGASDEVAALTERLQFTCGEGPCLEAFHTARPVQITVAEARSRWATLAAEVETKTPYRSMLSWPLRGLLSPYGGGALDLYFVNPDAAGLVDVADVASVAVQVSVVLALSPLVIDATDAPVPAWLTGPAAKSRTDTWIALGMLDVALEQTTSNALALLRAYAYSHERVLDDVARDLIDGILDARQLAV